MRIRRIHDQTAPPQRPRRRLLVRLGVAVFILATVAHLVFWYAPRLRSGRPEAGTAAGRLLTGGATEASFEGALWVPYPHQNAAVLARRLEEPREWLASAAELAEVRLPALPSFGPFALPPSRELTVAADRDGRRFQVTADVYPTVAVLARLAGLLAGNPWLRGGQTVGKRPVEVAWQGTVWTARSLEPAPQPAAAKASAAAPGAGGFGEEAVLAAFRGRKDFGPLPAGDYRLLRRPGELLLERLEGGRAPSPPASLAALREPPVALLATLRPESVAAGDEESQALLFFWEERGEAGAAVLEAGAGSGPSAAGVGLAFALGEDGYSGEHDGWRVEASGQRNYQRAARLVPALERWRRGARADDFTLEAAPGPALAVLERLESRLAVLSPASSDLRRLRALRRLCRPLEPLRGLSVLRMRQPPRLRLRLELAERTEGAGARQD